MTGGQIEGEKGLCAKASVPASLGLTSDIRGHVAIEHDVYAWEAWLTLRSSQERPGGTLAHWLGRRCRLTPKLYIKLPNIYYSNPIVYIISYNNIYITPRSEGLLKRRLAHICAAIVYQLYIYITALAAQLANTRLWPPKLINFSLRVDILSHLHSILIALIMVIDS